MHGLLGDGVASSTRPDPQAKGLGEYLRSRVVDVPEDTAVSDLPDLSAGELVTLVARGEASCVEVVGAHLDRIDALNPRVNAIVGLRDRADVLEEAAARDRSPTTVLSGARCTDCRSR